MSNLSKEEATRLKQRIKVLRAHRNDRVQDILPYKHMYKDGICCASKGYYTLTIQFYDVNYRISTYDEMNGIIQEYCNFLNYFDESIKFQLTFENQPESSVYDARIPNRNDGFDDIREEYSGVIAKQYNKKPGTEFCKFVTVGIKAENINKARFTLNKVANEITNELSKIHNLKSRVLNGYERLQIMYNSLNPYEKSFVYDFDYAHKAGLSSKDFIVPPSCKISRDHYMCGGHFGKSYYGAVSCFNIIATEMPDTIVQDIFSSGRKCTLSIHTVPVFQSAAQKHMQDIVRNHNAAKINEQKKAAQSGYDPDLAMGSDDIGASADKLLAGLKDGSEHMFYTTLIIRYCAPTAERLKAQQDEIQRIMQKNDCQLIPLDYRQEEALGSSLVLGNCTLAQMRRVMSSTAIAGFVPFSVKDITDKSQKATYYGVNPITHNIISGDRRELLNPNGIVLGVPGGGKSFATKREMLDVFLRTNDDIFICDPEGEYFPFVERLGGQVIRIAATSDQHINPLDFALDNNTDENIVALKSDFILSFMELVVGGQGLTSSEISAVDRCVMHIYNRFMRNDPTPEKMPTLYDLWDELRNENEQRLVDALEIYVVGSQNVFSHRTNVDMNNRIICFDIKNLGSQLRKIGSLIIQDTVWSRVAANRDTDKSTRYYIDEFHLLLREPQTAQYSVEMWKRFRKWHGIPTGITQNVTDLLASSQVESIFKNSDFVYLLNQASGDRDIIQSTLHLSDEQVKYITNSPQGHGFMVFGDAAVPFEDEFPKDTEMYTLMSTKPDEAVPQDTGASSPLMLEY